MRRLVGVVTGRQLKLAYPVAAGLTMLGLTGLLVSSISFGVPVAPAGAAPETAAASPGTDMLAVPADGASNDAQGGAGQPAALSASNQPNQREGAAAGTTPPAEPVAETSRLLVATLSAVVLLAGLALFFVARMRRRRPG